MIATMNVDRTPKAMTMIPRYVITDEMKRDAVKLLLRAENDSERLKTVATFSGFSISLLRQWEGQMKHHEPELYQALVAEVEAELETLFNSCPTRAFETLIHLKQLEQINRLQQMALDRVKPIFNVWEKLPLVWRVAAGINSGQYTIDSAMDACDLNYDVLLRCVGLLKIVKTSGGLNR